MYLGVDEKIVVEDYPLEVDEEDVGDLLKDVTLGSIRTRPAALAETIGNELPRVHAVKG